ncbi:hypothetical protein ACFRAM_28350 [Paenibacillus sp. NPDC056722]|uniref:hypothetical protein n=1 Tax=Paenibacillus sp. NPDC056722 TaxID=3345924 RepID=UPI0036B3E7D5
MAPLKGTIRVDVLNLLQVQNEEVVNDARIPIEIRASLYSARVSAINCASPLGIFTPLSSKSLYKQVSDPLAIALYRS